MQRPDWNVSELSELLAAHGRMHEAYTVLIRDRMLAKAGVEIPKHTDGFGISEAMRTRICTNVAKRLKQDDRTVPLYRASEEEINDLVSECIANEEDAFTTNLSPREQDSLKQSVFQMLLDVSASEEDPAINYAVTWEWIDAVGLWAAQHGKAPLAFFDQGDAHSELMRRTKSKERLLSELYLTHHSPSKHEQAKSIILTPLMALMKSEDQEASAADIEEITKVISKSIEEQMRRTYEELVADADRIYGTDTPALPS